MSPTVLRIGGYRFFFNSREETRRHIHVATVEGTAKFWLEPVVALAGFFRLSDQELRRMDELVREHERTFREAWHEHFRQ